MRHWRRALIVAAVLSLLAAALGYGTWRKVFGPGPELGRAERVLLIPTGALFDQVVDSLKGAGLVGDEAALRWLAGRKNYVSRIRPGRYVIASGTSLNALLNRLRSGEQDPVRVTFTNIRTLPQLAGQVARYVEADSMAMLAAMTDHGLIARLGLRPETMIGMFLPNTYEVWWTERPEAFIERMEREHGRFWNGDRKAKAAALGLSPMEVSTLASIVQAETAKRDEAPMIAGVYLNRLRIGMPLQADPTLKFALGLDSVNRVLDADKRVDSPYNTYTHPGLPPGPINMPEPGHIDAVLNATKHDHLYFCARETLDGYSNFARTYEQHLVNARRYQRALNARGIYR
ncbi:MAG: endolytic transglycosylase MltG [Flavobacteriales bacterium]|nr:endolytic transglycosylase MltG [Flavobacteriales bacterium]MBK7940789.1 endolytic transglycosylase MltG [Flavobacteriales bacterium]MBK9700793.1 endolytic transglycosylase MltG [Flavobacteriales bacterium]